MPANEDANMIAQEIITRKADYFRIAMSFCSNKELAMDALSETTVIACEKYDTLRDKQAVGKWITTILINVCRKYLRQQKRYISLENLDDLQYPQENKDDVIDIGFALQKLKPIYYEVVILRVFLDYDCSQTAQILHIPVGTVKSRYSSALKTLKSLLEVN